MERDAKIRDRGTGTTQQRLFCYSRRYIRACTRIWVSYDARGEKRFLNFRKRGSIFFVFCKEKEKIVKKKERLKSKINI